MFTSLDSKPLYYTKNGFAYHGDAIDLLKKIPDNFIDLLITSPPFPLQKDYGGESQDKYVEWLLSFADHIYRVLKEEGSFVLELGGVYKKGFPVRSLYNYKVLIKLCEEYDFRLAEEFFWYNSAKIPSPVEYVNKRKIRVKDAVNTLWWLSKTSNPKSNVENVLNPYSESMKKLLEKEGYFKPKERPSGHKVSKKFRKKKSGSIPSNLLTIANTASNTKYLRYCRKAEIKPHPARFPQKLPDFFIKFLTESNDVVLDIFAGSNTTGYVAEKNNRKWLAFDNNRSYLVGSAFRFVNIDKKEELKKLYHYLLDKNNFNVNLNEIQKIIE